MRSTVSPMRGIQTLDYVYIFNAWAFTTVIYYNNNEGITMQAMEKAAEDNQEIRNRVDFFRRRPLEEFYDLKHIFSHNPPGRRNDASGSLWTDTSN